MLAERYTHRAGHAPIAHEPCPINPFEHQRRHTHTISNIGGKNVPRVIADYSHKTEITAASLFAAGYHYSVPLDKWNITDTAADFIFCGNKKIEFEIPGTLGLIFDWAFYLSMPAKERAYPLLQWKDVSDIDNSKFELYFVELNYDLLTPDAIQWFKNNTNAVMVLTTTHTHGMAEQRAAFFKLMNNGCDTPVIIKRDYNTDNEDIFMLYSATDGGALLIDGLGDGLFISAPHIPMQRINSTAFGILQATRTRISKTEYISCPSCGRTLFDLQETTAKIRAKTSLKGIKIGIMGCIVNGPGEMADADYGYVGTGPGKINLYKEKEIVRRNINEAEAVEALVGLIQEYGDWQEPRT